ncbi:MAG TPA: endonuclease domain-containing protein [Xanthomonadales bacterium]
MTQSLLVLQKDATPVSGKQANNFRFSGYHYDPASGEASLCYEVDGLELCEKIVFPWAPWPVDASRQAAFYRALELLHLVAGISYYKAGLAVHIDTGESRLDRVMAEFLNDLYLNGLAEFAYVNQLDLHGLIDFEINTGETAGTQDPSWQHPLSYPVDLPERALVAMGGGKDSLVCLQMLRDAGIEVQPVCVGGSTLIGETVKAAGLPLIRIRRELSAGLTELNAGGAWNGHVPVTAINSAILLCAGLLYGYRYVVFANESSASEATLKDGQGREVNHQYSKSLEFEQAFATVVKQHVSPDIEYFSLLRPFSEMAVARRFSKMTGFHEVFSSCNRNFHQDGSHIAGRWCLDCPKCRFAALALAPFLTPQQLLAIQGADLLDQEGQLQGFKALCGLGEQKPFECVGTVAESRAAVRLLAADPRWQDKKVVSELAAYEEIKQAAELAQYLESVNEHRIPAAILDKLNAF